MKTIIHVSDIHFGRTEPDSMNELVSAFQKIKPDLVVISGDMTQRAHVSEYTEAKKFLRKLTRAKLDYFVIPGNHDIHPLYRPFARMLNPYERYKKYISKIVEPVYKDKEIAVASINTVRASAIKDGSVRVKDIEKVASWFSHLPADIVKIVVTHHPFDLPTTYHKRKLAKRAKTAIYELAKSKVDIYLSGHYHQSSHVHTYDRYTDDHYAAIAVQAGTVSLRQRFEVQSFNVILIDKPRLAITTYLWDVESCEFLAKSTHKYMFKHNQWKKI